MRDTTTVAVVGATGTAGTRVVARLRARGVAVVEISRTRGVDLLGDGLASALDGAEVVIDVSDPAPADGRSGVEDALATASRNLVGACAARKVQRLVVSTIAGVEDPAFDGVPYYEGKRAAKKIALDSQVPTTIVKSTQWYEFATQPVAVSFDGDDEVVVEDWLIQPIAADTVADVLVEAALGQTHAPRTVTGPRPMRLPDLTSRLLARRGDARPVRAVRPAIPALSAGVLLPPDHAVVVGPDADTWLRSLPPVAVAGDGQRATAPGRPDRSGS